MGQPKFPRKQYQTPNHPWQGERIKAENEVKVKFGLKNKREIWKAQTRLREIRQQGRTLVSRTRNPDDTQGAREADLLLKRLHRQGYVGKEATLNDVLAMDLERILNRRLQSQVYLKGLARTPKQARQFVSHGLIQIGERRITAPSYVVRRDEEELIHIDPSAAIADEDHPIRPKPEGYEAVQARGAAAAETVQEPAAERVAEPTKAAVEQAAPAKEAAPAPAAEVVEEVTPAAPAKPAAEPAAEPKADDAPVVEEVKEATEAVPEATPEPKPEAEAKAAPAKETKAAAKTAAAEPKEAEAPAKEEEE